jgi:hypothetical protein
MPSSSEHSRDYSKAMKAKENVWKSDDPVWFNLFVCYKILIEQMPRFVLFWYVLFLSVLYIEMTLKRNYVNDDYFIFCIVKKPDES